VVVRVGSFEDADDSCGAYGSSAAGLFMSIASVSIFSGLSPGVLALMQFIRSIRPKLIGTTASPSYPYQRKSKSFVAPDEWLRAFPSPGPTDRGGGAPSTVVAATRYVSCAVVLVKRAELFGGALCLGRKALRTKVVCVSPPVTTPHYFCNKGVEGEGGEQRGGARGGRGQRQLLRAQPSTESRDMVGSPKRGGVDLGAR